MLKHKNIGCFKCLLRHNVLRVLCRSVCCLVWAILSWCPSIWHIYTKHCLKHSFLEHLFNLYGLLLQTTCIFFWTAMFSYVSVTVSLGQNLDQIINVEKNSEAIIPCRTATYNYPGWFGQPVTAGGGLTLYNFDTFSSFFTSLTNHDRLGWASNNRDLVLSNVVRGDAGKYQCSTTGAGTWTVQLNVIGIIGFVLKYAKHEILKNTSRGTWDSRQI